MACTASAESTLGTTTAAGPAAATARRSSSCHGVPSPLMRIATSRRAVAAGGRRLAHPVAGLGLGVGGDGVLEVEDQGVGGQALGLLQRPLVGARHVEDRAAGPERSVVGVDSRRPCRPSSAKP